VEVTAERAGAGQVDADQVVSEQAASPLDELVQIRR
jgi:hypothetical protein